MTTNIEFDAVSNSWDEHTSTAENHISGVQVAQATTGQAASEPVPVDVGSGAPAANQPAADANAPAANAPASNAAQGNAPAGNAPANAAVANVPHEYHAEAGNVVKLPANVSIDNIKVDGHNLVLVQPDGSEIVIKDGALNVPTFILGDVEVPRVALIAALEASHVDVAFGADGSISAGGNGSPSSAGGNFEQPAGGIGDGFGLTALLPPTDLAFGQPEHRELFPGLEPNHTPTILDLTPSVEGGDTTVDEKGLETAGATGSGEAGTDAAVDNDPSEHNTGTFTINSPDGIKTLTINGTDISGAALANSANVHVNVTTPLGTLTITGYDAATGQVSYTYTLEHSDQHPDGNGTNSAFDNITVTVTDGNGDVSLPGTLSVQIVDDVPTAHNDTDTILAGQYGAANAATGNVITGAGTLEGTTNADVQGADGAHVSNIASNNVPANSSSVATDGSDATVNGQYGMLTIHADGSYSYVRNAGTPGGVEDKFTYTLTDGDNDSTTATLTVQIGDSTPTVSIPAAGGDHTTVYEAGLPARSGEPAGSGEIADGNPNNNSNSSETTSGTIGFTSADGLSAISLGGHALTTASQTFPEETLANGTKGQLTAWYDYSAATGTGTIHYTFTLTDNTSGDNTNASFAVVVKDADGEAAPAGNLVINVVDDVPTAHNDTDTILAGQYGAANAATGNVITGAGTLEGTTNADVQGADGAHVSNIASNNVPANSSSVATDGSDATVNGQYGMLTIHADGSYSYVRNAGTPGGVEDKFTYTLTDGDNDSTTATLTVQIGDSTPTVSIPAAGGDHTTVYEAGLPARSGEPAGSGEIADGNPNNNSNSSETTSGTIGFTSADGLSAISLGGHALTTASQTFPEETLANGTKGQLTAWYDYSAATGTGTIHYTFTLTDNTSGDNTNASFAVVVKDADGEAAPAGNLVINVVDDVPTAHNDTDTILAGQYGAANAATGNVITGAGTLEGTTNADVQGADGAHVSNIASNNVPANSSSVATDGSDATVNGQYGMLTIHADGSYSYVRNAGTPGGVEDKFTYTLTDGDNDSTTATLTVQIGDSTPTVSIPAAGGDHTTVYEAGLPARSGEPAGSGEIADGNPNNNSNSSETTSGTIGFTSADGLSAISLGGHALTTASQTFPEETLANGTKGQLTAWYDYSAATGTGTIHYTFTLTDNTSGDNTNASFAVVVKDADGEAAPAGNLVINVVDDVPTAHNDTDTILAGQYGAANAATGNVITGAGTLEGTTNADVQGADGAHVSNIASNNVPANSSSVATDGSDATVNGQYGMLTIHADGSYSYVRNAGTPGGVEDKFTYTLTDGDNDSTTATLTVQIGDSTPTVSIPAAGGDHTTVYEAGLPARSGEPAGSGEIADGNPNNNSNSSETTSGTIGFTSADGLSAISLGGHALTTASQTFPEETLANGTKGQLTAWYDYSAATGTGTIHYTFTLTDNTSGDNTNASFAVVVKDADGEAAPAGNLVINVVDDVPTAHNDTDTILAGQYGAANAATGNVITGAGTLEGTTNADVQGADGAHVSNIASNNVPANSSSVATDGSDATVNGQYGMLTIHADGSYSYVRNAGTPGGVEDKFTYTLTDGDNDSTTATLTVQIGDSTPTVSIPAAGGDHTTVYEAGLPARSGEPAGSGEIADGNPNNNSNSSETTSGTIGFTSADGLSAISLGGHALTTASQTFPEETLANGTKGQLTAWYDYSAATGTGTIHYTFTLTDNTSGDNTNASFAVVVKDADGEAAPAGNLVINVVDDVPTAHNDTDTILAGQYGAANAATGNVITGAGTLEGTTNADVQGADGAHVSNIASNNVPANSSSVATDGSDATVNGQYGMLTIHADGSYSYVRNAGTPGGVEDKFTYTLTDGDNDSTTATLTVQIGDSTPTVSIPAAGGDHTTVYEAGLPARSGEPAGSGEIADGNPNNNSNSSETTSGTIGFTSADGLSAISLGGHALTTASQTFPEETLANGTKGQLTAWYDYSAATGTGTIHYTFTLTDNTSGDNTNASFAVVVKDADGEAAPAGNLVINVVDDVPTAHNDTDTILAGQYGAANAATGNVITGAGTLEGTTNADVQGADGAHVSNIASNNVPANSSSVATDGSDATVNGQYGMLTIHADGSYSYVRNAGTPGGVEDKFTYTLTDGDNDSTTATLTVQIGDSTPHITNLMSSADGGDATVYEAGLAARNGEPAGSGELAASGGNGNLDPSEAANGDFTITSGDGVKSLVINGVTVIQNGALTGTLSVTTPGGNTLTVTGYDANTGKVSYTYTLLDNEQHATGNGNNALFDNLTVTLTDQDNETDTGTLSIKIVDDVPTLGPIDHGVVSDQAGIVLNGSLHLVAGADGISSLTISGTLPSNLTLDGTHHLLYQTVGSTLTAYADMNNSGTVDSGDTKVFTLNANAGTGTYEFDLLQPLTTMNSVSGSTSHGVGPSQEQALVSGTTAVALLSSSTGVNGSTAGWGAGNNNNFDAGENMRFDFTGTHSPAPIAGFNPSAPQYANFEFSNYKSGDQVTYTIHYTDNTTSGTVTFDPSQYADATHELQLGQAGKLIDYIDFVDVKGSGKVDLAGVASVSNVSQDLSFNVTATDHDGDTATGALTLHIEGGSTLAGTTLNDVLVGGAGNDILSGGGGTNTMTGGAGADTFKLDHLDIKDLITDYSGAGPGGQGDKIDLTALFDMAPGGNINTYVHYDANTKTLGVDVNGGSNFVDVAVLQNQPAAGTINILYDDTNHVQHPVTI
ncbi:Ig-like domain-containing protein [Mesorhizobium sp. J8]|uniref:Ig-like domain-containing protein n=1 Tax=Mesorhizobium sp. J8 TaxID=2777475 RepID=UPI0019165F64|nr:VCBS domain-containing protein [Mesorhizobium sp. J8]BCM17373.1 poly(beta-D-mannuronate) C5 epimerase 5 [Mesorhizobium sp. J8]